MQIWESYWLNYCIISSELYAVNPHKFVMFGIETLVNFENDKFLKWNVLLRWQASWSLLIFFRIIPLVAWSLLYCMIPWLGNCLQHFCNSKYWTLVMCINRYVRKLRQNNRGQCHTYLLKAFFFLSLTLAISPVRVSLWRLKFVCIGQQPLAGIWWFTFTVFFPPCLHITVSDVYIYRSCIIMAVSIFHRLFTFWGNVLVLWICNQLRLRIC